MGQQTMSGATSTFMDFQGSRLVSLVADPNIFTALVITLVFILIVLWARENKGLPPGPMGLPLIGYLPFLRSDQPHKVLAELQKKYGDVVSFKIPGGTPVIAFNTYETIREAFVKQGDNTTGLPETFTLTRWFLEFAGLEGQDGIRWKEQRRFMLQTLRDFGFGKTSLEDEIHEQVEGVVRVLENKKGRPYDLGPALANGTGNVVTKLFLNKKFALDDKKFTDLLEGAEVAIGIMPGIEGFRPLFILGNYIPLHWLPKYRSLPKYKNHMYQVVEEIIREHERTFDPNNLRDFVDAFLDKMAKAKPGTQDAHIYQRDQLAPLCVNMIIGGVGTTSDNLLWAFKLLSLHPHIQKKVQNEIDDVIGRERFPSYLDYTTTPYTAATCLEAMRMASLLPVTEYLRTIEETTIAGYRVPKNCLLIANLYGVHFDPKQWGNPETFDPMHFLGPDNKLKKDSFVVFFIGKRSCPGESLARMNFYIMFVRLLQKFTFTLAPGEKRTLDTNNVMVRSLKPFKIIATPRT